MTDGVSSTSTGCAQFDSCFKCTYEYDYYKEWSNKTALVSNLLKMTGISPLVSELWLLLHCRREWSWGQLLCCLEDEWWQWNGAGSRWQVGGGRKYLGCDLFIFQLPSRQEVCCPVLPYQVLPHGVGWVVYLPGQLPVWAWSCSLDYECRGESSVIHQVKITQPCHRFILSGSAAKVSASPQGSIGLSTSSCPSLSSTWSKGLGLAPGTFTQAAPWWPSSSLPSHCRELRWQIFNFI